ncbi:MAG: DUF1330 domain-containing protein [Novosphingobium sp.]|nr:DUF1330 domain-containing protein [Novosphingobium sp.]
MGDLVYIDPGRENFERFKGLPRDTPIHMLNLIRWKQWAEYPAGHESAEKGWTGRQAYQEYHRTIAPVLERVGAHIAWSGSFEAMVTGPESERWDAGFVMVYPNASAFFGLVKDAEYKLHVANRTAGVADSRLMRFGP